MEMQRTKLIKFQNGHKRFNGPFIFLIVVGIIAAFLVIGYAGISYWRPGTIHLVVPSKTRLTQKADLVKLCQTIRGFDYIHLLIITSRPYGTDIPANTLTQCGMRRWTAIHTDAQIGHTAAVLKSALNWIRAHASSEDIVYFADDGYVYDTDLFEKIRSTEMLSVWPIGSMETISSAGISDNVENNRTRKIDLGGFALKAEVLRTPWAKFSDGSGLYERFITSLGFNINDMDNIVSDDFLVWKTETTTRKIEDKKWYETHKGMSIPMIEV